MQAGKFRAITHFGYIFVQIQSHYFNTQDGYRSKPYFGGEYEIGRSAHALAEFGTPNLDTLDLAYLHEQRFDKRCLEDLTRLVHLPKPTGQRREAVKGAGKQSRSLSAFCP